MRELGLMLSDGLESSLKAIFRGLAEEAVEEVKMRESKPYMSRKEAQDYIGCGTTLFYELIAEGLPQIVIGDSKKIYSKKSIDEFLKAREM